MAIKSQADQRRNAILRDQHGREYSASIEKASGHPTGLVIAMHDVPHPQLVVPQKYMRFDPDSPTSLRIDYESWILDLEDAHRAWEANRIRTGFMIIPGFDSTRPMPAELRLLIGEPPMSPVPIKAMQQGNRWCLGFTKKRPPEADRFFPEPATAPTSLAFTETDVFTEPAAPLPAIDLAAELARLDAECPEEIKGVHRTAWKLDQLKQRAGVGAAAEA